MTERTRQRTSVTGLSNDSAPSCESSKISSKRRSFLKGLTGSIVLGTTALAGCEQFSSRADTSPAKAANAPRMGVYLGRETALPEWEEWCGGMADIYSFNVPGSGWDMYRVENMPFESPIEQIAADREIAVTMKMFPPSASTVSAVANGEHSERYQQLAADLVGHGMADATIRIGHEFNGEWASDTAVGQPTTYIEAWKQIVESFETVTGGQFEYIWSPHIGELQMDPTDAYPGDDWVDQIGLTVYDKSQAYNDEPCRGECIERRRQENWNRIVNQEFGLEDWATFARSHNKPLNFPEYGVVARNRNNDVGGGDNPFFINQFAEWVSQNRDIVDWHNVWSFVAGPHFIGPPSLHESDRFEPHPDASEAYRNQFGHQSGAGSVETESESMG